MKKRLTAFLFALVLISAPACVYAKVDSVKEPTAGKAVYIAGNPDLYPVEYYDSDTESYCGILPELYEKISENTGIEFSYVSAGKINRQRQLAKNCQAEIISAHTAGEITSGLDEYLLFDFEKDGKKYDICIGFTQIASPQTVSLIKEQLEGFDSDELLNMALAQTAETRSKAPLLVLICAVFLLAAEQAVLSVIIIKKRRAEKKQSQNKLTDPLTGIGNSEYYRYCFEHYISPASRSLYYVAYIATDIQKIKEYSGVLEADELERYAAGVVSSLSSDMDFAARITDGVFALAFQCPSKEQAKERIVELIDKLNGSENTFSDNRRNLFRAGIYSLDRSNVPCETALYNARQGYNCAVKNKTAYCLSDDTFLKGEALKQRLQKKLSNALQNGEFKLYLQFIVKAENGRICGAEALSRWQNPEEGIISPKNYIESMKNAGIIDRLDFHILEEVCRQLQSWSKTEYKDLWLSCNFTRITISSADFMKRFKEITDRYSFNRANLVIELTEDSLADNHAEAYRNILDCKKEGYRIALDDLGEGYTSFSDLCDYPVDIIKIDRHIVSKSVTERGKALLNGICRLAECLGITVLCEGVETDEENTLVRSIGCDYIQGYYYSRVYPLSDALEFCAEKLLKIN